MDDNEEWVVDDFEMIQKELKPVSQNDKDKDNKQDQNEKAP